MSFPFWAALTETEIGRTSTTPDYRIGTIGYTEDGRRFRYCKAGAAVAGTGRLLGNMNYAPGCTAHADEDGFEGVPYAAADAGATTIKIADTSGRALNYYQGGYCNIFHAAAYRNYYILSSTKTSATTDPGYGAWVQLELASGLDTAITVSTEVTTYLSPYSDVRQYGATGFAQDECSFVCLALTDVVSGSYFWGQTTGPAWVTAHGGTWPGAAGHYRDVFAHFSGTVDPSSVCDPTSGWQRVGYIISATDTGNSYGDAWVMLQLE
jgi:hypothetical protein